MAGVTKRYNGRNGNFHWYKMDGQKVTGVTTILGDGIPKPALMPWAIREVATYAATNLELLGQLEEDARIDLLKGSPYRDRDRAAKRGHEVHRLAERIARGETVEVPEELTGHVDSYIRFLDDFDVDAEHLELVVGHTKHRWMGTLDLIADLTTPLGRHRWLLDIKTTRSGIFGETALQLAAYRHADFYIGPDDKQRPMVPVDMVGAVWVRADGYDLVPVHADDDAYLMFRYAQKIADFTKNLSKEWVHDALTPPEREEATS